jgi:hypothetical protein
MHSWSFCIVVTCLLIITPGLIYKECAFFAPTLENVSYAFRRSLAPKLWNAQAYAALATVLNTTKRKGYSALQKLGTLMVSPVLPSSITNILRELLQ